MVTSRALGGCERLRSVRRLDLSGNQLREAGARALAGSPHLAALAALRLDDNSVGGPGIRAPSAPGRTGATGATTRARPRPCSSMASASIQLNEPAGGAMGSQPSDSPWPPGRHRAAVW